MAKDALDADRWLQALDCTQQLAAKDRETRDMILSFLEVLDAFDRCFSAIDKSQRPSGDSVKELVSFDRVRLKLVRTLEGAGVVFMACRGKSFDPHRHEAIEVVQANSASGSGLVLEEVIRGCEWNGKVLRQAKVVVARE